jgi:hypothetical protein
MKHLMLFAARTAAIIGLYLVAANASYAQQAPLKPNEQSPAAPKSQQDQMDDYIKVMLRRAQTTRLLAAEHLQFIKSNRDQTIIRNIEDASQVMAYDLVCEDDKLDSKTLNQIATTTSYEIAVLMEASTIAPRLTRIARNQKVNERMELMGDIATTVLMFEIGRRRGLFDALLTDFGKKRFCAGMQMDMRTRYNEITSTIGE